MISKECFDAKRNDPFASLFREPRPGPINAAAVSVVLGSVEAAQPFLLGVAHHKAHQPPEHKRQQHQPQIVPEHRHPDGHQHPTRIKRIPAPRVNAIGHQPVVSDPVINPGPQQSHQPDKQPRQSHQHPRHAHRHLKSRHNPRLQQPRVRCPHTRSSQPANQPHIKRPDPKERQMPKLLSHNLYF